MPYSLRNRNVLITGGSRGLGASVAAKFAARGSNIAINYANDEQSAQETAYKIRVANPGCKVFVVKGDMASQQDCHDTVKKTMDEFGGIDIIIANAGWTRFSDFNDLNAFTSEEWDKCWNINVKSPLFLLQAAESTFKSNPDGGVLVMTSSVAGIAPSGSSMAYSVTKAAGLRLMKNLASSQGPKIRVNAVLPGLLLTEWGNLYGPERIKLLQEKAALKKETSIEECAEMYISVTSNSSMTAQAVQVDAGLCIF